MLRLFDNMGGQFQLVD
jgi:dynein heavy chain, axonemal